MRSLIFLLLLSFNASAALYDRGNGLIYDDVLDITWLQDANYAQTSGYDDDGIMYWQEAKNFAEGVVLNGYSDWRLPSVGSQLFQGFNSVSNELGYMFYVNLELNAGDIFSNNAQFYDYENGLMTSFNNIMLNAYWNNEEYDSSFAWSFNGLGNQDWDLKTSPYYSWLVHDGDIGNPVPLPAGIWFFLSGLVGLGLMRGRNG